MEITDHSQVLLPLVLVVWPPESAAVKGEVHFLKLPLSHKLNYSSAQSSLIDSFSKLESSLQNHSVILNGTASQAPEGRNMVAKGNPEEGRRPGP